MTHNESDTPTNHKPQCTFLHSVPAQYDDESDEAYQERIAAARSKREVCCDNAESECRCFPTLDTKEIHPDQMEASVLKAYDEPAVAILVAKHKEMHRRAQKAESLVAKLDRANDQLFDDYCNLAKLYHKKTDLFEKSGKELLYEVGVLRGRLANKEELAEMSAASVLIRAVLNTALISVSLFFILLLAWKTFLL